MSLKVGDIIHTWPTMPDRIVLEGEIELCSYALIEPGRYVVRARILLVPGTKDPASGDYFVCVYRHGVREGSLRTTADRARALDCFTALVASENRERGVRRREPSAGDAPLLKTLGNKTRRKAS